MRIETGNAQGRLEIGWALVIFYLLFVAAGVANIYSATYDPEYARLLDFSRYAGKQLIFAAAGVAIAAVLLMLDMSLYERMAWVVYIAAIILLLGLPFLGSEVKGNRAWYDLKFVSLQPSEIAKFATALALSAYLAGYNVSMTRFKHQIVAAGIILLPMVLVGMQDTGSALVFVSFFLVLYLSGAPSVYFVVGVLSVAIFIADVFLNFYGVSPWYVFSAVGLAAVGAGAYRLYRHRGVRSLVAITVFVLGIYSVVHFFVWDGMFKDYQRQRILTSFKLVEDFKGVGFNTRQSEIAIGSGGLWGKGYLMGTQTKGNFVPEQHTDFIFSTLGEEWGFVGAAGVVVLYALFLIQIVRVAARQRTVFARNYGWCVFSIFFFHFLVNVAMAIGIMPVIGIPLPFFSYGGSSLWCFTALLFVLIKIDAHRKDVLPELKDFDER